ncbi:MAG: GDP-mannose 4,6-dehydratase, partial [Anaerolineae bacterium]
MLKRAGGSSGRRGDAGHLPQHRKDQQGKRVMAKGEVPIADLGTRDPRSTILHPKCILLTGCAGFIGWKVTEHLLAQGYRVVGVDNLNDAYDVRLKQWRLAQLEGRPGFTFYRLDI